MVTFDLLIIGAGQAISPIIEAARANGATWALAERLVPGGSCVNFGCTPTKAVLASARLAHVARHAADFGLRIPTVEVDFPAVMQHARDLVARSRKGVEDDLGSNLIRGHARFVRREQDAYVLDVDGQEVRARQVVIGTGTRSQMPKIEGLDQVDPLTGENWISRDDLPRRLAIVGGGYIAVEMGQFYTRMGSRVTIIDKGTHPLNREDDDVANALLGYLEEEGIEFRVETSFDRVERTAQGWRLSCSCPEGDLAVEADGIFVATGRQPNTQDLGLEAVGIETDDSGVIQVDEHLLTTAPHVFAVGDVRGGAMFTHTAWDDGRIVADSLFGKGQRTTDRVVPYAVFTDPQLGRVGMSETEAQKAGRKYRVLCFDMAKNAAAQEDRRTQGFVKLIVDDGSDTLLGAAILAAQGAEMIQPYADLLVTGAPLNALRDAVVAHPTYMEAVQNVLL